MLRLLLTLLLAAVLALSGVGAAAVAVDAADVTSTGFTDRGTTLVAVGTVDGLDPTMSAQVNLTMAGTATVICMKPGADTTREGVSVSQGGPADRLEPGASVFGVTTYAPVVTPENAGCPGSTVSVHVVDVVFSRAVVTVIQDGEVVAQEGYAL
jgi:hypothetical protein